MAQPEFSFDGIAIRQALINLPITSAWENLQSPQPSEIYVPLLHNKALSQDVSIVEGMRGAGKSFWTAVLADDETRKLVADVANIQKLNNLIVRIGFGLSLDNESFPTAKRISSLIDQGCTADDVWRSVLLRHLLKELERPMPFDDGVDAAALWVKGNRNPADHYLTECDLDLAQRGKVLLLLFDSLERLADDWGHIRKILSAALQLGLECRTRRAIRLKFFLRPDMVEEDDEIWRFADSSKLLHSMEKLTWRSNDLFGLILLHLANSPSVGFAFRQEITKQTHIAWQKSDGAYSLPQGLTMGEQPLRSIVEALAGAWVGNSSKRGFTFTWIPTHLSDAKGRLSPRSILLAFRHAAQWTEDRHADHKNALHYEGIQQGVVEASRIRINEIKEDYPWVGPLLEALKGATVPLKLDELTEKWPESCIKASLDAAEEKQRLPPRRYSSDPNRKGDMQALVDDLVELAILYRTEDKRLNMPDIFRVGFGIKRKGGVKLPR
ncbi:MAG: hypothetical protein I8H91_14630 [Burkholderiales bacterium]|nr:hypothetical protein [Burkholderiales bacterium]